MSDFPLSPNRGSSGNPSVHLKGKNLGEIFEAAGFLSKDQAAQLSAEARASGLRIQEGAVGLGFLSEDQVTSALALQSGFSALSPAEIDALIRRDALFEHRDLYLLQNALPLSDGRIAVDDPANIPVIARDLGISSFSSSRWCLAPRSYLSWRLSDLLGTGRVDILARLKTVFENPDSSPTKLLETLLESAWKIKASDIHIEPFSRFVRIRGRVEGHLRFWVSVTRETFDPVGNLIRTQSGLSNRSGMKSHDGEFTFMVDRTEIPVRVSLIPTIHRQFSVVLRLLGAGPGMAFVPEVLGFSPDTLSRLSLISDLSSGMALVTGPTGCHAKGTKILMADGSVKDVERIKTGERVMGPDGKSRRVLELHGGIGRLVRVVPIKGEPFVVNEDHILALRRTSDGSFLDGKIVCLSVREYEKKSHTFKHLHKLWRSSCDFLEKELPLSPYLLGIYLGDGCSSQINNRTPVITNPSSEILTAVGEEVRKIPGMTVSVFRTGMSTQCYRLKREAGKIGNEFVLRLRTMRLFGLKSGEKFIPEKYKKASRRQRLELLAGLIDTDGHLNRGGYDYITKSETLANDIVFLVRSLGLSAYMKACVKSCQGNFSGNYFRISISGDCSVIPVRVRRKKAPARRQKKSVLVTSFTIEEAGMGPYYGFELDGDHLYLTADFTVHHNSGKNTSLHAFFRRTIEKRPGTAFVEVADPIEYRLGQGVQSQVWRSETDQWSYGDALRSTLRHDPDIIMVGEIRDSETAGIALEAALTGHLLLSTLHVTEASAVFDRMGRLGLPPDDLLSVLRIVVNQRLVGRLCPSCRFETEVSGLPSVMETLAREKGIRSLWDAGKPDCPSCRGMGVLGRYAACEVMVLDHEIRRVLSKERTFGAVPLLETYRTLDPRFEPLPEILLKDAAEGKTGLSEILRIVGAVI